MEGMLVPALSEYGVGETMGSNEMVKRDIERHMMDLDSYKAHCPDGVSPYLLKKLSETLEGPLAVPKSFMGECSVVREWKRVNIVLIFKKGDIEQILCYRPV